MFRLCFRAPDRAICGRNPNPVWGEALLSIRIVTRAQPDRQRRRRRCPSTGGSRSARSPSAAASAGGCAPRGLALIPEVTLRSGRRADLVALSPDGAITIVEIKSSIEDFRADSKWQDYLLHSDHFYFATGPHVPAEIFPQEAGLIVADPYGAEILRPSGCAKIPARRARRC